MNKSNPSTFYKIFGLWVVIFAALLIASFSTLSYAADSASSNAVAQPNSDTLNTANQ